MRQCNPRTNIDGSSPCRLWFSTAIPSIPGDLSWADLEALGPTTVYDRTTPAETVARAAEGQIVLTNKTLLSREIIQRLPRLRYIGVLATGYNIVDIEAATPAERAGDATCPTTPRPRLCRWSSPTC